MYKNESVLSIPLKFLKTWSEFHEKTWEKNGSPIVSFKLVLVAVEVVTKTNQVVFIHLNSFKNNINNIDLKFFLKNLEAKNTNIYITRSRLINRENKVTLVLLFPCLVLPLSIDTPLKLIQAISQIRAVILRYILVCIHTLKLICICRRILNFFPLFVMTKSQ